MGKNERTRKSRSQRPAKVRIKAMLKLAKVKAKNNMFSHTSESELTQKRWGRLLSDGTKRIEVRAWSKTKLLNRLSSGSDPKVGRFTWSHEGHNTVTFMYPLNLMMSALLGEPLPHSASSRLTSRHLVYTPSVSVLRTSILRLLKISVVVIDKPNSKLLSSQSSDLLTKTQLLLGSRCGCSILTRDSEKRAAA